MCCCVQAVYADALVQSQALRASTIVQYYIDGQGVRVELEIGVESIEGFKNLVPDAIYQQFGFGNRSLEERLPTFFGKELAIFVEGEALRGRLVEIGP